MPSNRGVNSKVQAAQLKKEANIASKKAKDLAEEEKRIGKEWQQGSNIRMQNKIEAAALKADEALRKKREKDELLRLEEENDGRPRTIKSTGAGMKAKQKNKGRKNKGANDLSMLEDSLVTAAEKKEKAVKKLERMKKEENKKKVIEENQEEEKMDPLLQNTISMIGVEQDNIGRDSNILRGQTSQESGLDSALLSLKVGHEGPEDLHPEKRMKALHKAFEERMMQEMKVEYPGLKLSQYKEKIFNLWKKSPENPMNQH